MRNRATSAKPTVEIEVWYYVYPVLGAMVFAMPGWWFGAYGWDSVNLKCGFVDPGSPVTLVWQWFSLFGPITAAVLYCFIVVFVVVLKLVMRERQLSRDIETSIAAQQAGGLKKKAAKALEREIESRRGRRVRERALIQVSLRVARYPAIPVLTQSLPVLYATVSAINQVNPFWLFLASSIATALQGTLYFALFCMDPAIEQAWRDLRGLGPDPSSLAMSKPPPPPPSSQSRLLEEQQTMTSISLDQETLRGDDEDMISAGTGSAQHEPYNYKPSYAGLSLTPSGMLIGKELQSTAGPMTRAPVEQKTEVVEVVQGNDLTESQLDCMMNSL